MPKSNSKVNPSKEIKKKRGDLTVDVLDIKGKKAGTLALPKEIFGVPINDQLIAQAVRVYLSNQRKGTASTKTRGEVRGSTRKIYRQKGTGRARHGGIRAPIFVHGGVAFGPKPRDLSLKFPKKMKKRALFSALSAKLQESATVFVKGLDAIQPKTKIMNGIIHNLGFQKEKKMLLVIPSAGDTKIENVERAARNIEGFDIISTNQLNTYEVLSHTTLLFMDSAIKVMEKSVKGEENE